MFLGYLDGNGVSLPLTDDGWFQTGDSGRIEENGGLRVSGRLDNMFVSGGENIQPEEIESFLCGVSGVIQAVVVPVKDEFTIARDKKVFDKITLLVDELRRSQPVPPDLPAGQ